MSPLVLMVGLAVIVGLVLMWPWLRVRLPTEQARRAANVVAYRTRVAEVDSEQQVRLVDDAAATALRDEAAARLLSEAGEESIRPMRIGKRNMLMGVALAIVPFVIAAAWYIKGGSWRTAEEVASGVASTQVAAQQTQHLEQLVAQLRGELQQHPQDADRWALLGRSQMVLGKYRAAASSYAQANRRSAQSNPDWLVEQGLAQGIVQDRSLKGEPTRLFDAALKVAPDDQRALWYAGVAAAQIGNAPRARKLWSTLAAQPNVPTNIKSALEDQIAKLANASTPAATPAQGKPE